MYIQCGTVKRKGKDGRNRKLVEAYRDPATGQPSNRTVQKEGTARGLATAYQPRSVLEFQESLHAKNACKLVQKPDAGNSHVRFEEREGGDGARSYYCGTHRRKGE